MPLSENCTDCPNAKDTCKAAMRDFSEFEEKKTIDTFLSVKQGEAPNFKVIKDMVVGRIGTLVEAQCPHVEEVKDSHPEIRNQVA